MPWSGNRCPGSDTCHTFESKHCLLKCDHQCVPASVLVHIANKAGTDKHIGSYVSATSLLGCLRGLYLERTKDWYMEPSSAWYTVRGTLLHAILENPDFRGYIDDMGKYIIRVIDQGKVPEEINSLWMRVEGDLLALADLLPNPYHVPDWESETEYELPLGVIDGRKRFLRGTIDVLRPLAGEILDYKTVGDKSLPWLGKCGCKPEHELQFNVYRLLVERGYPVDPSGNRLPHQPVHIKRIRAFYMSMMEVISTGSTMVEVTPWLATEPRSYGNEIKREVVNERDDVVTKRGKRKCSDNPSDYVLSHKKKYHLTYAVPEVKLMDLDTVMKFVLGRATILFRAFDHNEVPALPPAELMLWKCDSYCPVKSHCDLVCAECGEERAKREEESTEIPIEGE